MRKSLLISTLFIFVFVSWTFPQKLKIKTEDCKPKVYPIVKNLRISGGLSLGSLYANCFDIPKDLRQRKLFDPYMGEKLTSTLKDSNGKTINTFVWYADEYLGKVRLKQYEIVGGVEALKPLSFGKYSIEFAVEKKVFYRFPFSVKTRKSKDPYHPGTVYMTDGNWRYNGSLSLYQTGGLALQLMFRDFDDLAENKTREVPFATRVIRKKDNKIMAEGWYSALKLNNNWKQISISYSPVRKNVTREAYKQYVQKILSTDGKYVIQIELNNKPYQSYEFEVKDGKVNGKVIGKRRIFIPLKGKAIN